jgi:uncharacterized membrane protein
VAPRNRNLKPSRPGQQSQQTQNSDNGNHQILSATQTQWKGPLPPPAVLREFDVLVPNGAERIFAQFEKESAHRRDCEEKQLKFLIRDSRIGQGLAGLYALCAFGVTAYAISIGANWVAGVLGGGTIVGGIVAFLRQKKSD